MIKVNLKKILREKNMTMTQLHHITGITLNTISLFATHKSNGIQYSTLEKITSALEVTVGELIEVVDDIIEVWVEDDKSNNYENLNNSHEYQDIMFTFIFYLKDEQGVITNLSIDALINYDKEKNSLLIKIIKLNHLDSGYKIREITKTFEDLYNGFPEIYYVFSHMIVDCISKNTYFNSMNIKWKIVVDWFESKAIPHYFYLDSESDSLLNNNDSLVFLPQICEVHLVPKNIKTQKACFDMDIPYVVNLEHLDRLKTVHLVEIDPITLERKVYLSGKSGLNEKSIV